MGTATSSQHPDTSVVAASHGRSAQRAVQLIVQQLEEDIVLGFLHPRERLVEDALIERFLAKRYAVREALARLERLGLVERLPNRGAMVRALTPSEVEDIYAVREILEAAAASEVLRRVTPEIIDRLMQVQQRHDQATNDGDPRAAFCANIEFHRAFFSGCDNAQLVEAIEQFGQKAHCIRSFSITHQEYLERSRHEHLAMIQALRDRDEYKLIAICRAHIRVAKDAYIESYRRRFPDHRGAASQPLIDRKITVDGKFKPTP
jgi:DNA-binding GntR family transcriptional regulator